MVFLVKKIKIIYKTAFYLILFRNKNLNTNLEDYALPKPYNLCFN
jgi:hypothetical protein